MMNLIEKINEVVKSLDEIEVYDAGLLQELSIWDQKEQDLLHYIENNKINIIWCYRMVKELKHVREKRRKVKNDMEILKIYREIKPKIISNVENRKIVLAELHRCNKRLGVKYKNRQYEEEELDKILRGA